MKNKSLSMFFIALLSSLVFSFMVMMMIVFLEINPSSKIKTTDNLSLVIFQFATFIVPTIFIALFFQLDFWKLVSFKKSFDYKILSISLLSLFCLFFLNSAFLQIQEFLIPNFLLNDYREALKFIEQFQREYLIVDNWYLIFIPLLVIALIPAISEEFYFRGMLQNSLSAFGIPIRIIVPSIIFALFHFQFINFIPLFLIGVVFALITFYTGNTIYSIILHFINNAASIFIINIYGTEEYNYNLYVAIGIFLISSLILFILIKFIKKISFDTQVEALSSE